MESKKEDYILGLDIGTNSVGWARLRAVPTTDEGRYEAGGIINCNSRLFDAGTEGDIESGQDASRNIERRTARLVRRQIERRMRKKSKLFFILQEVGLLPSSPEKKNRTSRKEKSILKQNVLTPLYKDLVQKWQKKLQAEGAPQEEIDRAPHVLSYLLRARALDEKLEMNELGLALYQLGQRRGFKSNRKADKDEKETGTVKDGYNELYRLMNENNARTLGEYFSKVDPHERRIRKRYTHRRMFENEFEIVWSAQAKHYPDLLTDELKACIQKALFFQRKLKSQKGLVGPCEHENGVRRCAWVWPEAQEFRVLQKVNDLRVTGIKERGQKENTPIFVTEEVVDKTTGEIKTRRVYGRRLTEEERAEVLSVLEETAEPKFGTLRKRIKSLKNCSFNLEEGGNEKLIGNKTASRLFKVFGESWKKFSVEEQYQIIEDLHSINNEEVLERRAREVWGLDKEQAKAFRKTALEDGYCNLSRKALRKILPLMREGMPYMTAVKEIYGEKQAEKTLEFLPPVKTAIPVLRNPAVERSLTETRKVVNTLIREYGKPVMIRVELARDLKRPRQQRKEISFKNRQNEKARDKAREQAIEEAGIAEPKSRDILKVLLAEECNWECPYTGKKISMGSLFGDHPQFDIEHIIPFSRSMDDSFVNKTLCDAEENRSVKRNRTPYEAYHNQPEKWDAILERVKKFKSRGKGDNTKWRKLTLFQMEDTQTLESFANRQLNDTRYASKLAREYLTCLFPQDGKIHVQVSQGQATAQVREIWRMNGILNDGPGKSRDDHRHHAVDAIATGVISPGMVKRMSNAAKYAERHGERRFGKNVEEPWPGFLEEARQAVEDAVVSHRVSRKVNGKLHDETFYGPPQVDKDGKEFHYVRKPLEAFEPGQIANIVDPVVREKVERKLAELGKNPKDAFQDPANLPYLEAKDGRKIPIKKARYRKNTTTITVGKDERARHVEAGSNHHIEIFEFEDKKGNKKWDGVVVSQFEALRRLRNGEPVVQRDYGEGKRFVFSLSGGDIIEIDENDGTRRLYRIRTIAAAKKLLFVEVSDARLKKDIVSAGDFKSRMLEPLRKINCKKVTIDILGRVRNAND